MELVIIIIGAINIVGRIDLMKKGLRFFVTGILLQDGSLVGRIDLMKKGLRFRVAVRLSKTYTVGRIDLMKKGLRLPGFASSKAITSCWKD